MLTKHTTKTHFPTKPNNELIFTEQYLEPDTIVFIDSIFDVVEEDPFSWR